LNRLDDWQLGELVVGHTLRKNDSVQLEVFWRNYNECLHCPGVPSQAGAAGTVSAERFLERRDDPSWQDHADDDDPK